MAETGIVIVTYFSEAVIGPCLDAALATGADVVVVDNGSRDATAYEAAKRNVRFIANQANRGFAAAANQGFDVLKSTYVLLLNPDAVICGGVDALCEACRAPGAAGAGGLLLGADERPQRGFMVRSFPSAVVLALEALLLNRIWPGNPVNRRYRGLSLDYSTRIQVEQPAGAFLMVRREVWEELRGFDEGFYPLWFEDVDFCRRAADHGYRWYFEPQAVAKHTGAHSIPKITVQMRRVYWYRGVLRYAFRHFRPAAFRGLCLAVLAGSFPRVIADVALSRSLSPVTGWWKVMRLACRSLLVGWRDEVVSPGISS